MRGLRVLVVALCACAQKPAAWESVPLAENVRVDETAAGPQGELWAVTRPHVFRYDTSGWVSAGASAVEHLSVVANDDVWGVGRGGFFSHWDGAKWTDGHVEPAAKRYLDLWGVAAWPGEVWATAGVEGYFRSTDGKEWSEVHPEALAGWKLERMSAIGRDVYVALMKPSHAAVAHFDGTAWNIIEQPSGLRIRGTAPDDVWIVRNTPVHFDGKTWTETPLPDKGATPYDLFARGPTEAYLVGKNGLALKWDGQAWSELPSGTRDDLFCVIGAAQGSVWAGGARGRMLRYPR